MTKLPNTPNKLLFQKTKTHISLRRLVFSNGQMGGLHLFNELIIHGNERDILLNEIIDSGYYKEVFPFSSRKFQTSEYKAQKNDILQMCLLADNVYIFDETGWLRGSDIPFIEIINPIDRQIYLDHSLLELDMQYAKYINPIVISCFLKYPFYEFFPPMDNTSYYYLCNAVFWNSIKVMDAEINIFKQEFECLLNMSNSFLRKIYGRDLKNSVRKTSVEQASIIIKDLVLQLEFSAEKECPILQSTYDFSSIVYTQKYLDNQTSPAYQILRIKCEDVISELPILDSLNDLIFLKNHNARDIHRLKEILSEFEERIRTDGHGRAIRLLTEDIQNAAKELAKKHPSKKISKFTQFLAVPVAIAEALTSSPPIASLTIEGVGILSDLASETNKRKNNWINVVR